MTSNTQWDNKLLVVSEILSALLLFGAVQQLLYFGDKLDLQNLASAGLLALLIANDILFILYVADNLDRFRYTIKSAIGDLITFSLLSLALVLLNPTKNLFDLELDGTLKTSGFWFWLVLAVYWLFILWWTTTNQVYYPVWPKRLTLMSYAIVVVFVAQAFFSQSGDEALATIGQIVACCYPAIYLGVRGAWMSKNPPT